MHWLDISILSALGIGAVIGFWSGLLWQIARVVSLLLSLYGAIASNTIVADWLGQQWKDTGPALSRIITFVAVFLLLYVVLYCLTCMIHKAIKATKLELVDRVLGSLLGMGKMAAIISAVCAGLTALALPITQQWLEHSTLAPHFALGTDVMMGLIPQEYRDRMDDNIQQARHQLGKKMTDAALDSLKQ